MKYSIMLKVLFLILAIIPSSTYAQSESMPVPSAMKQCEVNSDCLMVETGCDSCCNYDSLNKSNFQSYQALYVQECAGYKGGVCDCMADNTNVVCHKGECVMEYAISQ